MWSIEQAGSIEQCDTLLFPASRGDMRAVSGVRVAKFSIVQKVCFYWVQSPDKITGQTMLNL